MPKEAWSLEEGSREVLRPYFSVREYDDNPAVGFVPFRNEGKTWGLLLFTADDTAAYIDAISSSIDDVSTLIADTRPRPSSTASSTVENEIVPAEAMQSAVEQELLKADREQQTLSFLYIDFESLIHPAEELYPYLDSYFLYVEFLRLTAHYFRNNGRTIAVGDSSAVVILESRRAKSGRLLIHQLRQRIQSRFSSALSLPEPNFGQKHYPTDGEKAEEFLEHYL